MDAKTVTKKKKNHGDSDLFLDIVRVTGAIPALIWKKPRIHYAGDKKKSKVKGGVLIASNHVSFSDPILLYCVFWTRRLRFFATKDLYKNGLVTFLFNLVGCIQVDKENVNMGMLHVAVDKLKAGKALLIFPEGEVNTQQKETLGFKSGAVLMAQLSGVPIQPVYIVRPKKWYHPHHTVVGEPIDIRSMCSRFPTVDELATVSAYIREQELALEAYYKNHVQKSTKER